ncbi:MAG: hypothetical protein ABSF27_04770 [Candidatus Dormibacteria bacterium]|jgi:uncharacterized protein YfkK (UPF0435 family)
MNEEALFTYLERTTKKNQLLWTCEVEHLGNGLNTRLTTAFQLADRYIIVVVMAHKKSTGGTDSYSLRADSDDLSLASVNNKEKSQLRDLYEFVYHHTVEVIKARFSVSAAAAIAERAKQARENLVREAFDEAIAGVMR